MNKPISKFWGRTAALMVAGILISATVGLKAQDTAASTGVAPAGTDQTVKMDKFVVTGSYIPLSADAPAIPIATFDTQAIQATGETTNLMSVLTKMTPIFSGGLNLGPTNGNTASNSTNGGSQVQVRDLPTLVLIDGHRVSFSPVGAVGGYQFVDLNLIPVSAVDKIEILTDGASAIYGSDAVGGVVNIILKKDYNGFEIGSSIQDANDLVSGHWTNREVHVTGGVSDGKNSIMISAEWTKNDPLYQFQVSTSRYTVGTTNYPGVVNIGSNYYTLNPSLNAPPAPAGGASIATLTANGTYSGPFNSTQIINAFNLASKPTSIIGDERKSIVMDFSHSIGDSIKMTGEILYSQTDTFSQLNAQPVSEKIAVGSPFDPLNVAVTAHDRFVSYPRQYLTDTPSIQGIFGLDGKIGDKWRWNVSANYGEQKEHFQNPNLIEQSALTAAEQTSAINLFASKLPPATLASLGIFGTAFGEFGSSLTTYTAYVNGPIFTLPAGDIQVAAGGEFRREGYSATADINSLPTSFNWASGTVITPLTVSRNIWAEFGQIIIPIISPSMAVPGIYSLTSDDAVRHEEYAVTSKKPTVPLITLRWQPFNDQLTLRASYTKSFIAPSLFNLYGPNGIGFTTDLTNFKPLVGAAIANDGQANEQTFSNTGLAPSTAENTTFGFVYAPKAVKGFSITTDYFRIRQTSIVGVPNVQPILQDVELKGAASQFAKIVATNDFPGAADSTPITAPGQIAGDTGNAYIDINAGNVAGAKFEGFDSMVDYTFNTNVGRFDINTKFTYNLHYWAINPDGSFTSIVASATPANSITGGTIPRWRAYTSASWMLRNWTVTAANSIIPALVDQDDGEHINAYYTWDGSIGYNFNGTEPGFLGGLKGLGVTVGVNNLFNRQPSNDFDTFVTDNADISTYSPLGRVLYAEVNYKF